MRSRVRWALPLLVACPAALAAPVLPDKEDPQAQKVRAAVQRGAGYLKAAQKDGHWEASALNPGMPGGTTALALLALLEAGTDTDSVTVKDGLEYLRKVELQNTYVVSLQTAVFARAGVPADRERVRRNVDWLLKAAFRDPAGRLRGWSYTGNPAGRADNSNTQYAVMALHAAAGAGAKVEAKVWEEIRDFYVVTQQPGGGWNYTNEAPGRATFTMTCAGLFGLAAAESHLEKPGDAVRKAREHAVRFLGDQLPAEDRAWPTYRLAWAARAARLAKLPKFEDGFKQPVEWYRLGAEKLLRDQAADGSWKYPGSGVEQNPVFATSFALMFLAEPAKR